ncbi:hypothetical protein EHN06_10125 [Marinobacter sp. NP-4(2019)]|uniref:hypothetical protein n=1 Tax=Marinobacter sp. NP-4(2019) TaxID=2488665 RepID=UPI000FC3E65E|nr:hypothetical protein [Marinobacter sp. NP-4(2019)]AZT83868.1 hypothetical protein EHN06_10125 [Marinobacter sp. NP-4(2019)]
MNANQERMERFTAWVAIAGGIFAYLNVVLAAIVTGGDFMLTLDGARMLGLPPEMRELFRLSMFADLLGFYFPVLVIGGYLWHRFRDETGAFGDMAALAILLYVVVGVSGAAILQTALHTLGTMHDGADEAGKTVAESIWATVAYFSQRGLWWCEGPVVLFWGIIVGGQLKQAGWGASILVPLKIVGWCFGLFFVFGFFPALNNLTNGMLVIVVLVFPLWMILFGLKLLRRPELRMGASRASLSSS